MYPHTSYLIYATPRSGSYLLCEALMNTNLAGYPTEYFGKMQIKALCKTWGISGISKYAAFFDRVLHTGTTPNGVFGSKIIWQFFDDFLDCLREIPGCEKLPVPALLERNLPGLHSIWIVRRDKVRQSISFSKALQTGIWVDRTGAESTMHAWSVPGTESALGIKRKKAGEVVFDFPAIDRLRRRIEEEEKEIQEHFATCGVQPFKVVYEDFVQAYEETALQILDYLQIPILGDLVFAEREMKKQANAQSEEWVERYYQCKREQEQGILQG